MSKFVTKECRHCGERVDPAMEKCPSCESEAFRFLTQEQLDAENQPQSEPGKEKTLEQFVNRPFEGEPVFSAPEKKNEE